ncbi:hypothetical protein Tco_0973054 [Tanacetum coccineum]
MGTPTLVCVWSCPDFSAPAGVFPLLFAVAVRSFGALSLCRKNEMWFYAAEILLALEYENGFHKRNINLVFPSSNQWFPMVESLSKGEPGSYDIGLILLKKLSELDLNTSHSDVQFRGNVRDAISLPRNTPSGSSPLCSICQHKAPIFGKPPRWFSFVELELATNRFSQDNFLATQRDTSRWTGGCCKTTQTGNLSRGS